MTEEVITREKHPGRVSQGHRLAAIMRKRKKEILHNKEQSTEHSTVQSTEQSTEQPIEQPTEHPVVQSTVQSSVKSNDTYIYGVGMLAVLAIGVCIFFAYNKKAGQVIHEQPIKPKRRHML